MRSYLPAYDRNMQPAYDHMHVAYVRIQDAFYDRMQAACIPSMAPALNLTKLGSTSTANCMRV